MRNLRLGLMLCPALLVAAVPGERGHLDFRREATAAYQRKEYARALAATAAALAARPDSPRYLHNLAALSALTGDPRRALESLRQLAALGVTTNAARDPDLASLQGTPEFLRVLEELAANREPRGEARLWAELTGRTGILEGIAIREQTGDVFLSDVHHRCIWRRDRTGQLSRWSAEDEELFGLFGLAVDEARNTLWAAMTALPEMEGFAPDQKGLAGLAEFDLTTSELRRVIPVPSDGREHGLGDLTVAPDGTVYATDSKAPVIWQLAPGEEDLEKIAESPLFSSLQGIVREPQFLIVADYDHGLFTIALATGAIHALTPPKNTTLLGLDGIAAVSGGIVATQNGTDPQRIVHVRLSPGFDRIIDFTVAAAALPQLEDISLITVSNHRATVIAGSGWDGFNPEKSGQPRPHPVRLFQVDVP